MAEDKQGFFSKLGQAANVLVDNYIAKAQTNSGTDSNAAWHRKGLLMTDDGSQQQAGWIEKRGLVGYGVLRNMARKDSIILAIMRTRLSQVSAFAQPQPDKYSPGWKVVPKTPADMTREDKVKLSDPSLSDEEREELRFDIMKKLAKAQAKQDKEIESIMNFIKHCGMSSDEMETDRKRIDFDKFCKLITMDTLTYNYSAIEKIPQKGHMTKGDWKLHHFYPVSAGNIKYVTQRSAEFYNTYLQKRSKEQGRDFQKTNNEDYKYVQVVRGKVEAAWTPSELVYEPRTPTVDPEDLGYAPGELELLIQIVTAHLYAEAHNRNFFTQGLGTKGLLHIKGESISQAQLEGFKRQWYSQVINSRNAFRPPILGLADDVKWVQLAANNKDMEFDNWMHYLIRIICAVYQIDPAEINFDISKINTSTLNETSNETRIKSSRDKGLRPLLDYIENIINRHLLRSWDKDLADKYDFKFMGLDAETRMQEAERFFKEIETYKTYNEVRIEMGREPLENGDVIGSAVFTQYVAQKDMSEMAEGAGEQPGGEDPNAPVQEEQDAHADEMDSSHQGVLDDLNKELDEMDKDAKAEEKANKDAERKASQAESKEESKVEQSSKSKKPEKIKKAVPVKVEYYEIQDDED